MSITWNKQKKEKSSYMRAGFSDPPKAMKKWEKIAGLAAGGSFILFVLLFWQYIKNTAYELIDQGLAWLGKRQGKIYLLYETESKTPAFFWIAAVWFVCLLGYLFYKRGKSHYRYAVGKAAAVFACCLFAVSLCLSNPARAMLKTAQCAISSQFADWRYGTNEAAGLPDGDLKTAGQKKTDKKTQLLVKMNEPRSMYFRGFVGSIYEEGAWRGLDNQEKYKSRALFYWLHQNSFYGQTQLANLAQAVSGEKETKEQAEAVIEITNVSASRRYAYLPYELEKCPLLEADRIGDEQTAAQGFFGLESYYCTAYGEVRTNYPELLKKMAEINEKNGRLETYEVCQSHYREWVYASFLDVPDSFRRQFASIFGEWDTKGGHMDIYKAKQMILRYLNDGMQYDENPGVPEKKYDPLLYFLQQAGRGYDVQYASAATLMFRYMGIPARYVEGFLLTKEMARKAKAGEAVSLDGSCGHAWTEIYVDGAGWVPFEATPAVRSHVNEAQPAALEEPLQEKQDGQDDGASAMETENNVPQEAEQDAGAGSMAQKMDKKEEPDFWKIYLPQIVFTVIIIIIFAIVLTIWTIRKRKRQLLAAFSAKDRKFACQAIFSYCMDRLARQGACPVKKSADLEEQEACIGEAISKEYAIEWKCAYKLHAYVRFSGKEVSEELYEQMCAFLELTKKAVKRRRS